MKKLITFLMLLSVFGIGNVWADEVETFDYTTLTTASTTQNGITVALSKGGHSSSNCWQISDKDGTITISTSQSIITQVAITYTDGSDNERTGGGEAGTTITTGGGEYHISGNIGTWSNSTAQSTVLLTYTNKLRITKVEVTSTAAAKSELATFELNPNDVFKYDNFENYETATKTAINSFTFPYDETSPWLRLKLNLDKTYTEAGYDFTKTYFTIESSSDPTVIDIASYSVGKAADNRVYLYGVKMLKAGTSTLTFKFRGTSTYEEKTCQATITVTKPVPTLTVSANVASISDDRAQAEAGHEYTLTPTLMIGETNVTEKFDVVYTIENVDEYSNSASVTGANLYAGKTTGKFNVSAVATPKTAYAESYDGSSTVVGFDVNAAGVTGDTDDIFSVANFGYDNYASSNGVNQTSNKLDRTLKGFVYTLTDGTNDNTTEAVKYNNNNVLTFKANGHLGINEATANQDKCTIYRMKITYTANNDVTLLTNLSTNVNETITLSAGTNKTVELTNISRSWFTMTNTSSNYFTVSAIEILYTNGSLVQDKVNPTLSFESASKSIQASTSESGPALTTTPKTFAVTYSSSDETVATVDNYGVVTGLKAGTATITATGVSNDYFTEQTATYTLTVTDASPVTYTKWDFTTLDVTNTIDASWVKPSSKNYYENQFTTDVSGTFATYAAPSTSQLYELSFGRQGDKVKTGSFRLFSDHMGFNSGNTMIRVPATSGQLVKVTMGIGNLKFENATLYGDDAATSYHAEADNTEVTLNVTGSTGYVDLIFVDKPSLYKIKVEDDAHVSLSTFRPMGGQTYSYAKSATVTDIDNYVIYFQPAGAITDEDLEKITVTSSDNTILNVSSIKKSINTDKSWIVLDDIQLGEGGTATLNVEFAGNAGYKSASTTTPSFIVMAPGEYRVTMSDINIQAGNRGTLVPVITDKLGNHIGISGSTVYRLDDDDESFDYTEYFDFVYSCPENSYGVSMPSTTEPTVETTKNVTTEGNSVNITVTATPKPTSAALFTNSSAIATAGVRVEKKQGEPQINFYMDAAMTKQPVENTDYTLEGSTSVFENIKNGRLFYMSPKNEGDEIWFTYSVGSEAADVYRPSDGKPVKKSSSNTYLYQYRKGVPIHIDNATSGTVYVNFLAFTPIMDSSGKITYIDNGSPVKAKFLITEDGPRPVVLTYSPATTDEHPTVMNTALSVTANGTASSGNKVYAKFSSKGTNYTTEQLINEANVISGIEKTGVFSTEVNDRKITGVQIFHDAGDGYDYVSMQSDDVYYYEYATTLAFNTATEYATINQENKVQHVVTSAKYYNKDEKANIEELEAGTVTYAFEGTVPTGTTIDSSTGKVTIGSAAGKVVVVATYTNANHYTVNSRTSEMAKATAKYTIIISDPSQYLPVITPGTQNFSTTLNVTVKAVNTTGYDAYYMVVTDGSTPTAADIINAHNKVDAGSSFNEISVSTDAVVYAVTYNPNTDGQGTSYTSAIVSETYTKVDPIPAPTFTPDGTITGGYNYVTPTLKVEAFTQTEGAQVYYTLNGQDPVVGSDYTYVYDGLAGIQLGDDATTTIKAIAVKDGIESNVTTSVYNHTNIAKPTIKVDGTAQADGAEEAITSTTPITITNTTTVPDGYTATIYYTLDGSDPTPENGIIYTGAFTSPKPATLKAVTVFTNGTNVLSSDVSTVTLTMSSTNRNLWEAIETTTPGGKLDKDKRTITSVDDITATFGGADNTDFENYTIDDTSLGTPLDGVGTYSIRSSNDALDETGIMYTHTSSLDSYCETVHEKTFKIPAKGDFVRFEPTKDGNLTIWALQQGAVHFDQDATFCDQFIRRRPVYLVDEQGKSIEASEIESSARLSTKWTTLINNVAANGQNAFVGLNGKQNGVTNNLYTQEESYAIYNMYINYLTKNGVGIGDPIKPFAIHDGTNTISEQGGNLPDNSNDQTGYVLASGGYVKYVFPVKAGKSYYFFGHRTKVGIRGFQFIATESATDVENRTALTINADGTEVEDIVTGNTGKTVKVTLNRNFKANTWTTLVLPFSVSETALQTAFGDGNTRVDVIHFDNITGTDNNTISMKRHWYKMIVAGTPVMIYPRKAVTSVTFNGVQIEANTIDNITGECDDYTMMGTFSYLAGGLLTNDYYMNTSGNFKRFTGTTAAMKATRAWLRPKDANNAKSLMVSFEDIFSGDETTAIISIEDDINGNNNSTADDVIYNLQGQKVGKGSTSNLPQGVYIKNGKKIVVE